MDENETNSSVRLSLNSKGRYHWVIDIGFKSTEEDINIINRMKNFNKEMKEAFPKNTEDLTVGNKVSSRSFGFDDSEDSEG